MRSITAVGFDLDYTLASYKPATFETLAHDATVDKLVKHFGYPRSLYDLTFDWRYMARGLVIDKKRGNILKIDRHKYVKIAHHGFRALSRSERMETYNNSGQRHEFDEPDYAMIDTLFSLAEAHLFMQLVEIQDAEPHTLPSGKSYADLYRDVRGAVDLCHRDGSIKREVALHPEKYIYADPGLVPVLEMLRQSGKKLFLATNSLWDYSSVVMNWLIGGKVGSGERDDAWLEYFDVVITGCGKPRFFTERKDLFEVHVRTGMLWNTEGGSPMVPIGEDDLPTLEMGSTAPAIKDRAGESGHRHMGSHARVFQGGSYLDLHKMLGVRSGAEVLYVGDHVYSDLLRGKKGANWRTMLVIPELESELETLAKGGSSMAELKVLRQQRDALDDQIQRLEWRLSYGKRLGLEEAEEEAQEVQQEGIHADEECEAGASQLQTAAAAAVDSLKSSTTAPQNRNGSSSFPGRPASFSDEDEDSEDAVVDLLHNLREQCNGLRTRHRALLQAHHEAFHPVWGQLFKTGYQNSRYAHQVERFACIYASHVSNLMFYSPLKSYRGRVDSMAHEEDPGALQSLGSIDDDGDSGLLG